ncbi:phosphatase PAP2 family protein [Marinigracilibium pacificum]|uniref:Phosphatase PAP2 family protein n=1 Tax=Marinigracilibium pacificum TaxID=2729599 RepID=A0A848JC39_9BACT|nr:phosphatase PAP2 family protein [Marinigracilibium pacificum]NMM50572.1 phosphatase PAP2 family protein [Marinigracilibium pacificum]
MIEILLKWDTALFLALNELHSPISDQIWHIISEKKTWFPLYLFIILFTVWKYKKDSWWMILGFIAAVGLADWVASGLFKPYFGRLRPCHNEELMGLVHIVNNHCGGKYSFMSSHASTTFALASSWYFFMRDRFSWMKYFLIWSVIVAYSRIALGVHYPLDIICGGLAGFLIGMLIFYLFTFVKQKITGTTIQKV